MNDPQKIWQEQPGEAKKVSLEEIRSRVRKFETKGRREAVTMMAIGLVLCVFWGAYFWRAGNSIPRAGCSVISLWSLYIVWQAYRGIWHRQLAAEAPLNASLDFYRVALERRRDYGRHVWRKAGLTWCFVGLALIVIPGMIKALDTPGMMMRFAPIFVLMAIWLLIFFSMKKRKDAKLQREIDELKGLQANIQ